jgi:murein DD-endopeptidase MepM/ murein hydrolase activator NlpD
MQFKSIVLGMKSRGFDQRYGSGQFGASRNQGRRHHKGLDILAAARAPVFSPIDGEIIREAIPYPPFSGLLIRGTGEYAGYEIKLFYVDGLMCGPCKAGMIIGYAENLSIKYPGIPNHVHMEVRNGGVLVSPQETYMMCF